MNRNKLRRIYFTPDLNPILDSLLFPFKTKEQKHDYNTNIDFII